MGSNTCGLGFHMLDLTNPVEPAFVGCYRDNSFQDIQSSVCFIYAGPDTEHQGSEICIASPFWAVSQGVIVADVTDKSNPTTLARAPYPLEQIPYQGWVTADHRFYIHGDEGDEAIEDVNTRTIVFDIQDLDNPIVVGDHYGDAMGTGANQYIHNGVLYQANGTAGFHIYRLGDLSVAELIDVAFLDTQPDRTGPERGYAHSVYPFFASGNVILTDRQEGLFVIQVSSLSIFADGFESGDLSAWIHETP